MSFTDIFLGTAANDGTGTEHRAGGQIINDNFDECLNIIDDLVDQPTAEDETNTDVKVWTAERVHQAAKIQVDKSQTTTRTIYVETTGNDSTGDGLTTGTAYLTYGRALTDILDAGIVSNCTITVKFGSGTFERDTNDLISESQLKLINSTIKLQGDLSQQVTGFTVAKRSAPEILIYDVTAIGQTWTLNQYRDLWATDGSGTYWPITGNTAGTDSMVMEFQHHNKNGVDEIWQHATTINNTDNLVNWLDIQVSQNAASNFEFDKIKFLSTGVELEINDSTINVTGQALTFEAAQFKFGTSHRGFWDIDEVIVIGSLPSEGALEQDSDLNNSFNRIYCRNNNASGYGVMVQRGEGEFFDLTSDPGIRVIEGKMNCRRALKCVSATNSVTFGKNGIVSGNDGSTFLSYDATNVFTSENKVGNFFTFDNEFIDGSPSFFASNNEFFDPRKNLNITLPSIYAEQENNLEQTLADNTTGGTFQIGDKTLNSYIKIEYEANRASDFRAGIIEIYQDGTTITTITDQFSESADIGLTITFAYSGDVINLVYDTTSTGNSVEFKYDLKRRML